jgi:hypothetical protein
VDGIDALPDEKHSSHVSTEMALHVLAYNMKRVMSILGVGGLMEAIRPKTGRTGQMTRLPTHKPSRLNTALDQE